MSFKTRGHHMENDCNRLQFLNSMSSLLWEGSQRKLLKLSIVADPCCRFLLISISIELLIDLSLVRPGYKSIMNIRRRFSDCFPFFWGSVSTSFGGSQGAHLCRKHETTRLTGCFGQDHQDLKLSSTFPQKAYTLITLIQYECNGIH